MDGFTVQGHWWLPETPDHKIAGTLTFDPADGATLSLFGSLRDWRGIVTGAPTGSVRVTAQVLEDSGKYERVIGEAGNKSFTLEDCFRTKITNLFFGGQSLETVYANSVYRGVEFELNEVAGASEVTQSLRYLTHWVAQSGLSFEVTQPSLDSGSIQAMSATVQMLPNVPFWISRTVDGLLVHRIKMSGDGVTEQVVGQEFIMRVRSKQVMPVDALLEQATLFQHLISIGADRTAATQELAFRHPDQKRIDNGHFSWDSFQFFARMADHDAESPKPFVSRDPLFLLGHIGGSLGISKWLTVANRHKSSLGRLMVSRYRSSGYAADQLIHGAAALEAYDRRLFGDVPVAARNRTFADRMRSCVSAAGPLFEGLVGDTSEWIKAYKEQRDDIAHHLERNLVGAGFLYQPLAESAYFLYVLAILKEAGMPAGVFDSIETNRRFVDLRRSLPAAIALANT